MGPIIGLHFNYYDFFGVFMIYDFGGFWAVTVRKQMKVLNRK